MTHSQEFVFMKKLVLAAILSLAAISPASAETRPKPILCTLKAGGGGSWIAGQVVFLHQTGAPTAVINDPVIEYFVKKPVEAKVTADTAERLSLSWSVVAKSSSRNRVRVRYSLTMRKADLHVSMFAKPDGADNSDSAGGSCKRQ
jgi:hypothetical protein